MSIQVQNLMNIVESMAPYVGHILHFPLQQSNDLIKA
jgi:hypothetical protein